MNGRTPGGKLKSEIGLDARFALDSLLEGDGFKLSVPRRCAARPRCRLSPLEEPESELMSRGGSRQHAEPLLVSPFP